MKLKKLLSGIYYSIKKEDHKLKSSSLCGVPLRPDLVKIDVEGAETLVMEGAKTLTKETNCTFFIEMHNVKDLGMVKATEMMIAWSKKMDYKVWYLKTGEELISGDAVKSRGKCHLLLLPSEKPYFSYLKGIEQSAPLPKTI